MKVIKFYAEWCEPCKMLSKVLEDYTGNVIIAGIDIDTNPEIAINYGVRGVPTLILVDDSGVELRRKSGMMTLGDFEKFIKGE